MAVVLVEWYRGRSQRERGGAGNGPRRRLRRNIGPMALAILLLGLLPAGLLACNPPGSGSGSASSTPTVVTAGNGFGSAANHVHSLLALPAHVLLLATHYGLFRSEDGGQHWQEVAGGQGQIMEDLMTYSLTVSSRDPQRLYVLTYPSVSNARGTPGLYMSKDQGRTWHLMVSSASLTRTTIFLAAAGNDSPDEVYIYLSERQEHGLLVSHDSGSHFREAGTLPFSVISGLLPLPGAPGHLLVYSSAGMALSSDGGVHWRLIAGIKGGIFDATTAGPNQPIYASGDAGMYISRDGGRTFTPTTRDASARSFFLLTSLVAAPSNPHVLYGETATSIYRSTDDGQSWTSLPTIRGNLSELAVDPADPFQLYLSLSYPTAVYVLSGQGNGAHWQSLTPAST
ncbi:WD40/YVTN/BNR-like repeat-containing protein [Thermogemmatispora onikobensis]|uniref:WD40/YVTN/BNR-like repeat-containing protein n=1 Tax=Thermogemmatispora onikobensis TaxID=732234 RepID=UPI000B337033|nr:sialidase family protein [Thermogemmatispora onikobensis]